MQRFVRGNQVLNQDATFRAQQDAREAVAPVVQTYQRGQTVIRDGQVVYADSGPVGVMLTEARTSLRVSLRSKDIRVDVSKICGLFGGGGHPAASGARVAGSLDEVRERVLAAIDVSLQAAAE